VSGGGNRQAVIFQEIEELGELEGRGGNAKPTLAVRCVEWAANGDADVGDAKPIYERYIQKVESVAAVFGGLKKKADPESGLKQNVSKIRQFLKMGGLKTINPVSVINDAAGVVKEERAKGTIFYAPFDALLNIARKQCVQTQVALSRQEMIDCNQPKERGDIAEADSLQQCKARLEKHVDDFGDSEETTTAIEVIDARIESLGGTTAEKKRKQRAEKKAKEDAEKKAAKRKVARK
jgi:hypothetical protein